MVVKSITSRTPQDDLRRQKLQEDIDARKELYLVSPAASKHRSCPFQCLLALSSLAGMQTASY